MQSLGCALADHLAGIAPVAAPLPIGTPSVNLTQRLSSVADELELKGIGHPVGRVVRAPGCDLHNLIKVRRRRQTMAIHRGPGLTR